MYLLGLILTESSRPSKLKGQFTLTKKLTSIHIFCFYICENFGVTSDKLSEDMELINNFGAH